MTSGDIARVWHAGLEPLNVGEYGPPDSTIFIVRQNVGA